MAAEASTSKPQSGAGTKRAWGSDPQEVREPSVHNNVSALSASHPMHRRGAQGGFAAALALNKTPPPVSCRGKRYVWRAPSSWTPSPPHSRRSQTIPMLSWFQTPSPPDTRQVERWIAKKRAKEALLEQQKSKRLMEHNSQRTLCATFEKHQAARVQGMSMLPRRANSHKT
jgi:hypothetical protein